MESPLIVLASTSPGDLVASRSLLAALACRADVQVAIRRQLLPLVGDLPVDSLPYDLPWPVDTEADKLAVMYEGLGLRPDLTVLDLVGMPSVMQWLRAGPRPSMGYRVQPGEDVPYLRTAPWHVRADEDGAGDTTHFGVRLLRIIPGFETLQHWPPGYFEAALYPGRPSLGGRLALAPGCGRAGADKRMPVEAWRPISQHARSLGQHLVWFIGPDEVELIPQLVDPADEVISGGWDEVLRAHASCDLGVTNDTCHMHLRAHLARQTLAFFRRPEVDPWGAYPYGVTCVAPPTSHNIERSVSIARHWLQENVGR